MKTRRKVTFVTLGNVIVEPYSSQNPPPYPVTSIAGKTGDVSLSKSDVGLTNVDNVKQYSSSNPPSWSVITGKPNFVNTLDGLSGNVDSIAVKSVTISGYQTVSVLIDRPITFVKLITSSMSGGGLSISSSKYSSFYSIGEQPGSSVPTYIQRSGTTVFTVGGGSYANRTWFFIIFAS